MIKINLLEKKSKLEILFSYFNFFILEIFILIIVITGVISIMYFMNKNLNFQDVIISREIDALNGFLRPLQKRNAEIVKSYKEIDDILNKINIVVHIKDKVSIYYDLLIAIAKSAPEDCWVSSLDFNGKNNTGKLIGNALRVDSVKMFVNNLNINELFSSIEMRRSSSETEKDFDVNTFIIFFKIREGS